MRIRSIPVGLITRRNFFPSVYENNIQYVRNTRLSLEFKKIVISRIMIVIFCVINDLHVPLILSLLLALIYSILEQSHEIFLATLYNLPQTL
jgi:hypothetical protein